MSADRGGFRLAGVWIGYIPRLMLIVCRAMSMPVAFDMIGQFARGDWAPATIVGGYLQIGAIVYALYGRHNSVQRREALVSANGERRASL